MIKYSAKEIKEDFLFIVVCKFEIVADVQGNGLKHHLQDARLQQNEIQSLKEEKNQQLIMTIMTIMMIAMKNMMMNVKQLKYK